MFVFDTDIISAFAKANALPELSKMLGKIHISKSVYQELKIAEQYGYNYPSEIFSLSEIIELDEKELEIYNHLIYENKILGKGELQTLVICKNRDFWFSSFDKTAINFAKENGIKVFLGKTILRKFWEDKICSVERVKEIVKLIEEKDNRELEIEGVFKE